MILFRENSRVSGIVTADMAEKMGAEKGTMRYFYSLFPRGIHQAFQLAGLPLQGFCF